MYICALQACGGIMFFSSTETNHYTLSARNPVNKTTGPTAKTHENCFIQVCINNQ